MTDYFPLSEHCCKIRRLWIAQGKNNEKNSLFQCSPVGLNPNLRFLMKAQCLYTHLYRLRWICFLIVEYKGIFHMLSLTRSIHSCLSVVFLPHSLHYDVEIRHHAFFPRPDVLFCYVKSSWHVAMKWKQLLVLILLHIFITRYVSCILIPHILPGCHSLIFFIQTPLSTEEGIL